MIRMNPMHDTKNPPGQVVAKAPPPHFSQTVGQAIEEYTSHERVATLQDAFKAGYEVGYQTAKKEAQEALNPLDPYGEAGR